MNLRPAWIAILFLLPAVVAAAPIPLQNVFAGKAESSRLPVELAQSPALAHTSATYTGNQQRPEMWLLPVVSGWVAARGLGERYHEQGFHDQLVELEDAGKRYSALVAYPANLYMDRLQPGRRVDLLVQRIGYAYGRPVVVVFFAGKPDEVAAAMAPGSKLAAQIARPIRQDIFAYARGELRFEYASRKYNPATMDPNLVASTLRVYRDQDLSELHLAFGDIQNIDAKLRLRGLARPGTYTDYKGFDGSVTLAMGVRVPITPAQLRDCRLKLLRLDAKGAEGKLRCSRAPGANEVIPVEWDFSVTP